MMNSIRMFAVLGAMMAAWVGLSGWVISELSSVKQTVDTVAKQQANPVPVVGVAGLDSKAPHGN